MLAVHAAAWDLGYVITITVTGVVKAGIGGR